MKIAADINLRGFSSRNLYRYLSEENRELLQNNRLTGDKCKSNKKSTEQSSASGIAPAVTISTPYDRSIAPSSSTIPSKFIAISNAEDAIFDAMAEVAFDDDDKNKELEYLRSRNKQLEQANRMIRAELETMKNGAAKTRQNFVILDCKKFRIELGTMYMNFNYARKLTFDDNYQVIQIE
jgi:hypothetical protein